MAVDRLRLRTALPAGECIARLRDAIDDEERVPGSLKGLLGDRPVIGSIRGASVTLRKRLAYQNSFQTFFRGTVMEGTAGAMIDGTFGMNATTRAFMMLWFATLPVIIASMLAGTVLRHAFGHEWRAPLIASGMLLFSWGFVRFRTYVARGERGFLREFLVGTLEATEVAS